VPGQKVNANLTPASCFLLVKTLIGADLAILVILGFADFFAIDCHSRMLDARHPLRLVARFKQIVRRDCKLDFSAVAYAAMSSVAHYHIELHFNCSLRSFCIYYNRLVDSCQVKFVLINRYTVDFTENKDSNTYENDYPPHFPFIHFVSLTF